MPQQPPAPPAPAAHVTAAEISRIAGVTRATVSNWRRRHDDFPAPSAGTETSPLYDLPAVQAWLRGRGHTSAASPTEELRTALRLLGPGSGVAARLFPLVAAASRRTPEELAELAALPDAQLIAGAEKTAGELPVAVPEAEPVRYGPDDAGAVRALLGCVREAGAQAAVDVLAERELDEGAASGVYQTPEGLALLMARLLPAGVSRVLDPACGSGTPRRRRPAGRTGAVRAGLAPRPGPAHRGPTAPRRTRRRDGDPRRRQPARRRLPRRHRGRRPVQPAVRRP